MQSPESGLLADAIAGRQAAFLQAQERLQALEAYPPGGELPEVSDRRLPEALLRRALQCLAGSVEYHLAQRILREGSLHAGPALVMAVGLQALSQAGLATWDPSTGEFRPTELVAELMRFFEAGIEGVLAQPLR